MKHRLVLLLLISSLLAVLVIAGCSRPDTVSAVLAASPSEGAAPLLVEFNVNRSTYGSSGTGSFILDFGDGTNSVQSDDFGMAIPHVYGPVGTYIARLTVIASDGRTAESTTSIVATGGAVPEGSAVGTRAYDFTALTTDGREITLHELRGSVVLIEFWGSWCIPCKTSMPHINALWEAYHDQGLVVLAVSTDTRAEDAVEYLAKNGFTGLACLWEPGGKSTRIKLLYQVDWIPRSIIVDRTGIVRYNGHPMDLTAGFVEALLSEERHGDLLFPQPIIALSGRIAEVAQLGWQETGSVLRTQSHNDRAYYTQQPKQEQNRSFGSGGFELHHQATRH